MALAFKKMKLTQFMIATVFLASIVSFSSMVNEIETMDFIGSIVNRPCNSNIQMPSQKQPIGFSRLFRKAVKYLKVEKSNSASSLQGCGMGRLRWCSIFNANGNHPGFTLGSIPLSAIQKAICLGQDRQFAQA
ncbi:TPA: hypothetical protein ACS70C_003610 [Providencia alcalifaciens]